jgi:hypothetical protein
MTVVVSVAAVLRTSKGWPIIFVVLAFSLKQLAAGSIISVVKICLTSVNCAAVHRRRVRCHPQHPAVSRTLALKPEWPSDEVIVVLVASLVNDARR